jgi:transglutaminase-like putative cysteine protease
MLSLSYRSIGFTLLLTACLQSLQAKDPDYNTAAIPANLKENAHAVKRMEEMKVRIVSPGEVRITRHYVVTVLDAKGEDAVSVIEVYNKLVEVKSIKGYLYDSEGKEVRKLKQSEISDVSGTGDAALMSDNRFKVHRFEYKLYPYTVEYETELKVNHAFYLPAWTPQEDEEYAVEQSKLMVSMPADYKIRYKSFRYNGEPVISNDKDGLTYSWEVKGLTALPDESYTPEQHYRTTSVMLAPSSFEMQEYKGSMNSWEELGHFVYTLNKDRDVLPDGIKKTVHDLTDGRSDAEKTDILYHYLQKHTRYILVKLGLGGWQTFDANYVAGKGYGDCKALSNYMVAMLKEAGVPAHSVLVHAGMQNTRFVEDFPCTQFDHVIVCVPGKSDTTWLECTSNHLPTGYLSSFTADRPVLVLADKGSKLVRTPAYTIDKNLQVRNILATVSETGDMTVNVNTHYTGLQQDDVQGRLHALSHDKIMEKLRDSRLMPSYDVKKYDAKETGGVLPVVDEQLEISAHNYAAVSGKRMFLEPNLMSKNGARLDGNRTRVADISVFFPYRDIDTVQITIPAGYQPESMPPPVMLKSEYGEYRSSVQVKDNQVIYIRSLDHKAGLFPASGWNDFAAFNNAVYKADRARIVLVKP